MRASEAGRHISGAERIVSGAEAPQVAAGLVRRALAHPSGTADFINVKLEKAENPLRLDALEVSAFASETPEAGWNEVERILAAEGFGNARKIRELFRETYAMRGAMLLDADTLERLEPDSARGVRATNMDSDLSVRSDRKDHFREALVLATKVANAPGIVGEICMSDDPGYVTGYVATRKLGYRRIMTMKAKGDPSGGRIFLYRGPRGQVAETIRFLEHKPVVVCLSKTMPEHKSAFESMAGELDAIAKSGCRREIKVAEPGLADFASNDYLGLAGSIGGSGASRLVTGTTKYHLELERTLAEFKNTEAALCFATGYMANVGVISAIAGKEDAVFSDELNHASIIDGCRLSGARIVVYRHLDMADLERKLAQTAARRKLVVSDAVFSMDGDMLPLPEFVEICRRHGAISMIDEAHANGVVGKTGRGLVEHFGCDHPDIELGTLSKAFGAEGGFVATSAFICDYLVNKARSFIFSTAPSIPSVKAALDAVRKVASDSSCVEKLHENIACFRECLASRGIVAKSETAIFPVVVGDEEKTMQIAAALKEKGFLAGAIRYPTVARGAARLRIVVSAAHSFDRLRALADAIRICL